MKIVFCMVLLLLTMAVGTMFAQDDGHGPSIPPCPNDGSVSPYCSDGPPSPCPCAWWNLYCWGTPCFSTIPAPVSHDPEVLPSYEGDAPVEDTWEPEYKPVWKWDDIWRTHSPLHIDPGLF